MITWENYEEYIMMYTDGELPPAEEIALMQFISEHPQLKSELDAYVATRLAPDTTQVYWDKELLLKPLPVKRTIVFPNWKRYSIAAGIAALVFVSVFKWAMPNNDNTVAVKTAVIEHAPLPTRPTPNDTQINTVTSAVTSIQKVDTSKPSQLVSKKTGNRYAVTRADRKPIIHDVDKAIANILTKQELASLPAIEIKRIAIDNAATKDVPSLIEMPLTQMPAEIVVAETKSHKRSFLDRLPLDDANKQQLKTIGDLASGTVEQVNNIKESLLSQGISIQINQKTIVLNF